jgi:hypothetical protein
MAAMRARVNISGVRLLKTYQPEPDFASLMEASMPRIELWKARVAVSDAAEEAHKNGRVPDNGEADRSDPTP